MDTLDLDLHTDVLAHSDEARAWLADAGLRDPDQPGFDADLGWPARSGRACAP